MTYLYKVAAAAGWLTHTSRRYASCDEFDILSPNANFRCDFLSFIFLDHKTLFADDWQFHTLGDLRCIVQTPISYIRHSAWISTNVLIKKIVYGPHITQEPLPKSTMFFGYGLTMVNHGWPYGWTMVKTIVVLPWFNHMVNHYHG